ncbi:uncharacterized protein BO96DRAFT_430176 [Aspergillus niger CBS 101883]|uniref:uncharacterized protein n=1 Tax=Aspergillus lacticoffeatus (strain CBS 101883) TaxID=1450533 RepID=UPI000D803293|nr:uncharacterized protein BO96DRAFT_430176 [Aspergillus niger CBS 101883]PYH61599.1 hypothetical protein BO96DRAFT_430176 [Aspergillus niger CBS 101883]
MDAQAVPVIADIDVSDTTGMGQTRVTCFRRMRGKAEEKDGGAMINGLGLLVGEAWYLYLCVRPCSCALPALGPVHWWIARLAVPHERFHPLFAFDPGNDGEIGLGLNLSAELEDFQKQLEIGCQSGLERRIHGSKTPTIPSIKPVRETNALFTSLLITVKLRIPAHGDSRESCCQPVRCFFSNLHTGEHIITLACGVNCPRAPPDGLLFVPHQPKVIDAMKKLP